MDQEVMARTRLHVSNRGKVCTLWMKCDRLQRWFISVEDRQQGPTLGSLGRVHRAVVHCRVGIGYDEGTAWEQLSMHLLEGREKTNGSAIKPQPKRSGRW